MKRPEKAPTILEILGELSAEPEKLKKLLSQDGESIKPIVKGKYLHWSELKYKKPPDGLDHILWWGGIKLARSQLARKVPLKDAGGRHFSFTMPDTVLEKLHIIDGQATGRVAISENVITPDNRNRYIVSSLIEEAIRSSQLEGASTSRKVASNMLRAGRKPKDRDERMILNNYLAMKYAREARGKELTPELVLSMHKKVTDQTLDNPTAAGKLQTRDDARIGVYDNKSGKLLHNPPPAEQLETRLDELCDFANRGNSEPQFIHPVVKAIILHFWIGFDHPFEDGNGRLARALFYWSMLRHNYWLVEFISISRSIKKAPAKYGYAYLHSETDDNDLTYFLIHQLEVIISSIDDLEKYMVRKTKQIAALEKKLQGSGDFNHRQLALLGHAIRGGSNQDYTFQSHQTSHGIAYATARADLLDLEEKGLLIRGSQKNRAIRFYPVDDLETRIDKTSEKSAVNPVKYG